MHHAIAAHFGRGHFPSPRNPRNYAFLNDICLCNGDKARC
jgi:hypothetical protein